MKLMGKVAIPIEKNKKIDLVKKIKTLNLTKKEKLVLFIHANSCGDELTKECLLMKLSRTLEGEQLPDFSNATSILELMDNFETIGKDEVLMITSGLISKINEDDEEIINKII